MKSVAAFMVISLLSRSQMIADDRQYDYPTPSADHIRHPSVSGRCSSPPENRVWKPTG